MSKLEIRDLKVSVVTEEGAKEILRGVNLTVNSGETHAIMGPNGSGKSNVVDAVRWVLGEQSVKQLRGEGAMSDVIFSGSKSRRAANFASVSLIFDNTDKLYSSKTGTTSSESASTPPKSPGGEPPPPSGGLEPPAPPPPGEEGEAAVTPEGVEKNNMKILLESENNGFFNDYDYIDFQKKYNSKYTKSKPKPKSTKPKK